MNHIPTFINYNSNRTHNYIIMEHLPESIEDYISR
jgi:hypothetical protein